MHKYFLAHFIIFLIILLSFTSKAQTRTNLDIFKSFVDLSVQEALVSITDKDDPILVSFKLGSAYNILEDQVYRTVQEDMRKITSDENTMAARKFNYSIESSSVQYGEVFRDGLLGDHLMTRKLSLQGSYRIMNGQSVIKDFNFSKIDTVKFEEIESLENSSYPFTKGEIPAEPFLSNLFEPITAITAAAVVITLFFTVRSK
jgi:hypothetical protein